MPAEPTLHPPTTNGNGARPPLDVDRAAGGGPPGGGPPAPGGPGRRPAGPSTRPALIVVGIGAVVLLVGGIGSALTGAGSTSTPKSSGPKTVRGATIEAVSADAGLRPVIADGEPPGDILAALVLPKGSTVRAGSATDNGIGLYDRSLSFQIPFVQGRVVDFFRAELRAYKWQIESQGAAGTDPGYRIVAQHPSSDGDEWEFGATIEPTTFGTGSAATGTTEFTVRLFAVTDDD